MLFMGVLSVIGLPDDLRSRLESLFGPISVITDPFPFDFTDYYVPEMGEGIERFFISFSNLVSPDSLASIKTATNSIEEEYSDNGNRKINLDPGLLSLENAILATTKNRSHRIAIGNIISINGKTFPGHMRITVLREFNPYFHHSGMNIKGRSGKSMSFPDDCLVENQQRYSAE